MPSVETHSSRPSFKEHLKAKKEQITHLIREQLRDFMADLLPIPITVYGSEHLEELTQAIYEAAPHNGHTDSPLIRRAIRRAIRKIFDNSVVVLVKEEYFSAPENKLISKIKDIFNATEPIPTETSRSMGALRKAKRLMEKGVNLVVYPEGGRENENTHKTIAERTFQPGVVYMLRLGKKIGNGIPVVPVFIEGARDLWRRGEPINLDEMLSASAVVVFGKPIYESELEGMTDEEATAYIQQRHSELEERYQAGEFPPQERSQLVKVINMLYHNGGNEKSNQVYLLTIAAAAALLLARATRHRESKPSYD